MTKAESNLSSLFINAIDDLLVSEKNGAKTYSNYVKAAFTPELSKALSPDQTNIKNHIQRLNMIKGLLVSDKNKINASYIVELASVKISKTNKSATQDVRLISVALQYQGIKLANYEILHNLALATSNDQAVILLEQCIKENQDTSIWLRQILKNIVLPSLN